jgi:hypothetical protein
MNKKTGLFAAAWALSCGTAFLIGRTSSENPSDPGTAASSQNAPVSSSRSAARGGFNDADSSSGRRKSSTRSSEPKSERQIEALKSRVVDLKNMSDPIARAEGFLDLVRDLEPGEYLSAIDAFREGGIGNEQFGEYRLLLTAWAQVNPLEALDYAGEKTGTPFARQTILAAWAKNDTESAVAWAKDNFDNEGEESRANPWLVGVIEGISTQDLGRATQLLEELPFSRGRGEALDAVFEQVTADGNESAKLWVAQLTDQQLKESAAARLAGLIASEDPQAAAEWATSLSPEILKRSAGTIVDRWAETDLEAAKNWVDNQPADVMAASGPRLIENIIAKEDIASAGAWLSNFEGNPAFDESVRTFVGRSMKQEPTTAANWIMKLSSTRDQERTFHRVLGGWMQQDREGAMNYINNNPVPDSIKRRAGMTREEN